MVDSYKLYSVSLTGNATKLLTIPDGPGFPRLNSLNSDTYYVSDFENLFHINLLIQNITSQVPFNSVKCVAPFQYFE